ncbi:MAG TPA: hypothetical protein VKZ68_10715 [Ohtaekwangia sp.]|nr:hypothetical protein [Ohtaekwangia sp.]
MTSKNTCDQAFSSATGSCLVSVLLYVGQVYWLQAEMKAANATKARIFFIDHILVKNKNIILSLQIKSRQPQMPVKIWLNPEKITRKM